jgi:hypothetical protein
MHPEPNRTTPNAATAATAKETRFNFMARRFVSKLNEKVP